MARKVERFEDLLAWQKGLDLTEIAYQLADRERLRRDFALRDQIHGSVISIPANIAEGFERGTRGEFHHFLSIAKASCAELRSHRPNHRFSDPRQVIRYSSKRVRTDPGKYHSKKQKRRNCDCRPKYNL